MDRGAWRAIVHGVVKGWTQLSDEHFHFLTFLHFSSVLAWRIPGMREPGGCRLWGHTESDMTEVT